ncbi:MAG: tetratricopeptide repeat protein [Anaeromyxobacteraceae bacterium]
MNRGSEVLARGEAEGARTSLERALELRPKDSKVLGLLGQAYYKLARYDDAGKVWQKLVDDNPVEPSARVNLGLARLKGKRYPDAVKQLEIALDLNPEHKKAMGYLGLALLESGEPARAKEWFKKAGSDQMVARCDEVIAGKTAAPLREAEAEAPAPEVMPVAAAKPPPPPPPPPRPAVEAGVLATWAAGRVISAAANAQTFVLMGEVLAVTVKGEVRVRLDGLFATRGKLSLSGEVKRFRGRPTEKPFGEGAWRMHLASGEGTLLVRSPGRKFTVLDLGSEAAYFREEVLFGFEDALAFENGRVPSSIAVDLNLVHLRGNGNFLLATGGNPVAIDVTVDAPLKLPLEALVGWVGGLTPKVSLLSEDDPTTAAVELTGEGRVLADPGAGWGDLP